MRQVKGLVLVRLPTAWEERKLRKPQLKAAAKALQMKYATWSTFPGLKISLNFLLSFCNSKSVSRHKSFQPQGLRKYHRSVPGRVALIVSACQLGWEEMENLRGKGLTLVQALRSRVGAKGCWRIFFKNPTTQLRIVWGLTEKKCEQTPKFACFSV